MVRTFAKVPWLEEVEISLSDIVITFQIYICILKVNVF